jgi:hypothetical protein
MVNTQSPLNAAARPSGNSKFRFWIYTMKEFASKNGVL